MTTRYLSFGSNNIQVYAYEGFDYTVVNPPGTTSSLSNSSGLDPTSLYFTNDASGNTRFTVSDLASTLVPSTRAETFTLTATNGVISLNSVTINPGRFLDASSNTLLGKTYTFYKNEPISNTLGYPFRLVAPSFKLKQPTSIPTLPPGLSFVRINDFSFDISGYPLVTVPNSNYQIIGVQDGGSKVITTKFNMAFSNERVQLNTVNPLVTNMQIGTPITPCVITSIPPIGTSAIRYTFPVFPDGLTITDISGIVRTSPAIISNDSNYTLVLSGAPTSNAAYAYKNANIDASGVPFTISATRIVPAPLVTSSSNITIAFGETILFDLSGVPPLYVGVPIDPSSIFFRAQSYFDTCDNITSITASSLPPGVLSNYTTGADRMYLYGTPSTVGSGNYTIQATNVNGKTRDYTVPITVAQDTVSFIPPTTVDVCFNFVLSRPVSSKIDGYYPSNIQFVAEAASRLPVTLSAPALAGTGLSLDSNGVIAGIPTSVTPLTDLTVTASVTGSPATASKTVKFAILNDQFTFTPIDSNNLTFAQNVEITPFQIPVTTLSGRNVIDFSQSNLPSGLSINPAGVISGIPTQSSPTSGNFTVIPTTGYASGTRDFSYNLTPDTILFTVPQDSYSYIAGQTVNIEVDGTSYSGTPVRNFALTLPPSYGLNIDANSGLMGGMWTDSIPPNQVLPSSCNFDITANAGTLNGTLPVSFTANPVLQRKSFIFHDNKLWVYNDISWNVNTSLGILSNVNQVLIKNNTVDANFIVGTYGNYIFRGSNGLTFTSTEVSSNTSTRLSSLIYDFGGTNWWVGGSEGAAATIRKSIDNTISWYDPTPIVDVSSGQLLLSRDSNRLGYSNSNPYILGGVALARSGDIILAGGLYGSGSVTSMFRSVDNPDQIDEQPLVWRSIPSGFAKETAYINVDSSSMWVATGSDVCATYVFANMSSISSPLTTTNTVKYSTDKGATWSNASNAFNLFGYEVIYASNTWLATGLSTSNGLQLFPELRYSTDAMSWTNIDLSTNPLQFANLNTEPRAVVAPMPLGSLNYDGSKWNVFVQRNSGSGWVTEIYSSPTVNGTWTASNVTSLFTPSMSTSNDPQRRMTSYTRSQWLRPSDTKIITIALNFTTGIGNGPQITSPPESLLLYQYVSVDIEVASDDPTALFFIADESLPPGLEFNPLTGRITGKPAQTGTFRIPIYAKNASGVTLLTVTSVVNIPRVIRKQDGAGAYTSLLKQYTEVLGAQRARDSRALPAQETRLGEFMSPVPSAVTTAVLPKACLVCRRAECPGVIPISINAGSTDGASSSGCAFIDGNTGATEGGIDVGTAETNCN